MLWLAGPSRTVSIHALDIPHTRTSWPQNIGTPAGSVNSRPAIRDQSPTGTTQGERIHRVWLAAGTYDGWLDYRRDTTLGICEVLIGAASLGTIDTSTGTNVTIWAAFPSTAVVTAGLHNVTIRKTTAAGGVAFQELVLRRIS